MTEVLLIKDKMRVSIKYYRRPKGIKIIYTNPPDWGAAKDHVTAEKFYKTSCDSSEIHKILAVVVAGFMEKGFNYPPDEEKIDLRKTATDEKKKWRENTIAKLKKSKSKARKAYGTIECPTGYIMKEGYMREGFTKKNGTKVRAVLVKPTCIKKKGLPKKFVPPKGKPGIGPLKQGELSSHGYSNVKSLNQSKRRKFLNSAIGEHGSKMVLKKLSALKTLQKRTNPEAAQIFHNNSKWLRKKYDDDFKASWTTSKLFEN
jgi:hypothetical protein